MFGASMKYLNDETKHLQSKLANYVRSGDSSDLDSSKIGGLKKDKLHHYRRLVSNIINNSLSNAYPITKGLLNKEEWQELVYNFFLEHNSSDPQIWSFPYQLYEYVINSNYKEKINRDYLDDLLYFEWVEMEVSAMEDIIIPEYKNEINIDSITILNPYIKLFSSKFPVFHKDIKIEDMSEGNYFAICYRNIDDFKVNFIEIDAISAIFVEKLIENQNILDSINYCSELINMNLEYENFEFLINELHKKQIILGSL
jgi:hypothetical protein